MIVVPPPPGETELPQSAGSGRTLYPVWPSRNDGNVYVGTTANIVLEVDTIHPHNTTQSYCDAGIRPEEVQHGAVGPHQAHRRHLKPPHR